jgi:hypothetical protein
LKRKGALLVASSGQESFTLRFYPDRDESLDGEYLRDLELSSLGALAETLSAMGFAGVPAFIEHIGSPPEVLEFLEIQLTKPELRKFGLLGNEPARAISPPAAEAGALSEDDTADGM